MASLFHSTDLASGRKVFLEYTFRPGSCEKVPELQIPNAALKAIERRNDYANDELMLKGDKIVEEDWADFMVVDRLPRLWVAYFHKKTEFQDSLLTRQFVCEIYVHYTSL